MWAETLGDAAAGAATSLFGEMSAAGQLVLLLLAALVERASGQCANPPCGGTICTAKPAACDGSFTGTDMCAPL